MPLPTSGTTPADPFGVTTPPVLTPQPLFLFTANADRYEVAIIDGEPELIPVLSRHTVAPGFHGIALGEGGVFDVARDTQSFRAKLARRGEVAIGHHLSIPADLRPEGTTEGGYSRQLLVRPNATATKPQVHHHEVWEVITTDRRGMAVTTYDQDRFARWRRWLRDEGHVPAPSEAVKAQLVRSAETILLQRRQTPSPDAALKAERVEAAEARVTAARNALSEPRPKTKADKPPKAPKAPKPSGAEASA